MSKKSGRRDLDWRNANAVADFQTYIPQICDGVFNAVYRGDASNHIKVVLKDGEEFFDAYAGVLRKNLPEESSADRDHKLHELSFARELSVCCKQLAHGAGKGKGNGVYEREWRDKALNLLVKRKAGAKTS